MSRIFRAAIISLAFISHASLWCPIRIGGPPPDRQTQIAIRTEWQLDTTATQRDPEQPGCFAAFRRALNNRTRNIFSRSSRNQVTPISSTPAQTPAGIINIPARSIASIPVASNQAPATIIETPATANPSISESSNPTAQNTQTCTICLNEIEASERSNALPCAHTFHAPCINTWLENNNNCPICRAIVDPARQSESDQQAAVPPSAPLSQFVEIFLRIARESNQNLSTADHEDTESSTESSVSSSAHSTESSTESSVSNSAHSLRPISWGHHYYHGDD